MIVNNTYSKEISENSTDSDRTTNFINNVYGAWKSPETAEELISVISEGKSCKDPISFD